jgi:hypothetical protein
MPCTSCSNTFGLEPCKHSDGNLNVDDIPLSKYISKNSQDDFRKTVIKLYKNLHNDCPCIECLVKMICKLGVKCPIYQIVLLESATHDKNKGSEINAMQQLRSTI